jgi:hypothetical protein
MINGGTSRATSDSMISCLLPRDRPAVLWTSDVPLPAVVMSTPNNRNGALRSKAPDFVIRYG